MFIFEKVTHKDSSSKTRYLTPDENTMDYMYPMLLFVSHLFLASNLKEEKKIVRNSEHKHFRYSTIS